MNKYITLLFGLFMIILLSFIIIFILNKITIKEATDKILLYNNPIEENQIIIKKENDNYLYQNILLKPIFIENSIAEKQISLDLNQINNQPILTNTINNQTNERSNDKSTIIINNTISEIKIESYKLSMLILFDNNMNIQDIINMIKINDVKIYGGSNRIFAIYTTISDSERLKTTYNLNIIQQTPDLKINMNNITESIYNTNGLLPSNLYLNIGTFNGDVNLVDVLINHTKQYVNGKTTSLINNTNKIDDNNIVIKVEGYKWNDILSLMNLLAEYKQIYELKLFLS